MRIVEIRSYEPRPKKPVWPFLVFLGFVLIGMWADSQKKHPDPAPDQQEQVEDRTPTSLPVSWSGNAER
jgi:hypothetical protein